MMNISKDFLKAKKLKLALVSVLLIEVILLLAQNFIPAYMLYLIESNTDLLDFIKIVSFIAIIFVILNVIKAKSEFFIELKKKIFVSHIKIDVMRLQTKLSLQDYIQSARLDQFQKLNNFFFTNGFGFEYVLQICLKFSYYILTLFILTIVLYKFFTPLIIILIILFISLMFLSYKSIEKQKKLNDIKSGKIARKSDYYFDSFFENDAFENLRFMNEEEKVKQLMINSENTRGQYVAKVAQLNFLSDCFDKCLVYLFAGIFIIIAIITNDLDIATLWIIIYSGIQYFQLLSEVVHMSVAISEAKEYDDLYGELFNQETVKSDKTTTASLDNGIKEIEFKNVSYKYPSSDSYVIKDFNVKFITGQKYCIIGENGVGKSTIIDLMLGLLKPTKGQILINGIDIISFNNEQLIDMTSTVFQQVNLYPLTLNNNITMSQEKVDDDFKVKYQNNFRIIDKYADSFEKRLTKEISDDGISLSGGESQQLSIIKALWANKEVLVFDEPTSSLDAGAELKYYEMLNNLTDSNIVVMVTHRMAGCKYVDQIIYLEDGRVLESGHHDELLKLNQAYARFYNIQASKFKGEHE